MLSDSHTIISLILWPILWKRYNLSPFFSDEKTKAQRGLGSCPGSSNRWRVELIFRRLQRIEHYRDEMDLSVDQNFWRPNFPPSYKKHPLTFLHLGRDLYVLILWLCHVYLTFYDSTIPLENRVLGEWIRRWMNLWEVGRSLSRWIKRQGHGPWDGTDWEVQSSSRAPLGGLTPFILALKPSPAF